MSIRTNQQLARLRKITVISGITLRAHFSLGIVKFNTLSNLLLTLGATYVLTSLSQVELL